MERSRPCCGRLADGKGKYCPKPSPCHIRVTVYQLRGLGREGENERWAEKNKFRQSAEGCSSGCGLLLSAVRESKLPPAIFPLQLFCLSQKGKENSAKASDFAVVMIA